MEVQMGREYRIRADYETPSIPVRDGEKVYLNYHGILVRSEDGTEKRFKSDDPYRDRKNARDYVTGLNHLVIEDSSVKLFFTLLETRPEERYKLMAGKITPLNHS
jgi:hypothetical protein